RGGGAGGLVARRGGAREFGEGGVRGGADLGGGGAALGVNDTGVTRARLRGRRIGRGAAEPAIEATLNRRIDGARWRAFVKPAKRLAPGDVVRFGEEGKVCFLGQLDATIEDKGEGGEGTLAFPVHGAVPLPPYTAARGAPDAGDAVDYQTVFARGEGSVAAPTAGLHFTDALIARLRERGIAIHTVTLHVGPATFLPVKVADTAGHRM